MAQNETFTAIPTELALRQSEINALRNLGDQMSSLGERLQEVGTDLKDVRERLITLEAGKFEAKLADFRADYLERIVAINSVLIDKETRLRTAEKALFTLGGALAILAAIGGSALGILAQKVFGG